MTSSNRALQALCQRCGKWREAVNQETEWTCRECCLEAQGQRLLAIVEARGRERDAALKGQEEARAVARELAGFVNRRERLPEGVARVMDLRAPWLYEGPP